MLYLYVIFSCVIGIPLFNLLIQFLNWLPRKFPVTPRTLIEEKSIDLFEEITQGLPMALSAPMPQETLLATPVPTEPPAPSQLIEGRNIKLKQLYDQGDRRLFLIVLTGMVALAYRLYLTHGKITVKTFVMDQQKDTPEQQEQKFTKTEWELLFSGKGLLRKAGVIEDTKAFNYSGLTIFTDPTCLARNEQQNDPSLFTGGLPLLWDYIEAHWDDLFADEL